MHVLYELTIHSLLIILNTIIIFDTHATKVLYTSRIK